jgi:protein-S-isoprenylcysteine O-methyltransferase Ste14
VSREALLLLLLNFLFVGALPRIFFRKGGLQLMWWITALPLFLSPVVAVLVFLGVLQTPWPDEAARRYLSLAAVALSACSIALIALTIGSNRVPLALWHQKDDAPQNIVTFGAYRRIRHPFYASFLLALTAAVLLAPHILTALALLYGFTILNYTAAREEARLSQSTFGEEYRQYMTRSGRFFPKWKRNA